MPVPDVQLNQPRRSFSLCSLLLLVWGVVGLRPPTGKHIIKVRRRSKDKILGRNGFDPTLPYVPLTPIVFGLQEQNMPLWYCGVVPLLDQMVDI